MGRSALVALAVVALALCGAAAPAAASRVLQETTSSSASSLVGINATITGLLDRGGFCRCPDCPPAPLAYAPRRPLTLSPASGPPPVQAQPS